MVKGGVFLVSLATLTGLAFTEQSLSTKCEDRKTCGDCMSSTACLWCFGGDVSDPIKCFDRTEERQCPSGVLIDTPSDVDLLSNAPINLEDAESGEEIIQISPQRVKLRLRPGATQRLDFRIAQSSEYPVDIYFLLDLSWSMSASRDNFAEQAEDIINEVKSVTGNLLTGFGSFVEKNLPPFTSAVPSFNCPRENPNCTPPYSYFHQTTLGDLAIEEFKRAILEAPLAGNVDEPEGGLDALMQSMTCSERVGWREKSRKIILLATDRDFHFALDGKLAGVLERNDGTCHLNGTAGSPGYYTHSALLDYPSVSHLNAVAQEGSFVIIFAVIPQYRSIWESLAAEMPGSYVEILEEDSANIVELIRQRYAEITSTVTVQVDNVPEDVFVTLKSDCGNSGAGEVETNACAGVELGSAIDFAAEVSARKCLKEGSSFIISPVGLKQLLSVEVETICECDCETPGNAGFTVAADQCSEHGDSECGICDCYDGYSGSMCECFQDGIFSGIDGRPSDIACHDPASFQQVCSGLGQCVCGACLCDDPARHYGRYCQCDDTTCLRDESNRLCSNHGECKCGDCVCLPGWTGEDCSCNQSTEPCFSPYNGEECSASGSCECAKCQCLQGDSGGLFSGVYCERAPGEVSPCLVLKDCVECLAFGTGPLSGQDSACSDCGANIEYAEVTKDNLTVEALEEAACTFDNDAGCSFTFTSLPIGDRRISVFLHLTEKGEKDVCPDVNALTISLSLFGAILLIGLLALLIWKCYIVVDDRRIVAKFDKETKDLLYATNQNPNDIYRSPITKYENPMYGKAFT